LVEVCLKLKVSFSFRELTYDGEEEGIVMDCGDLFWWMRNSCFEKRIGLWR
jgi:hypothetical protein